MPSSAPRSIVPRWCHVTSTSTATLNRLAKLGAMTYDTETYYLGAVICDAEPLDTVTQNI